MDGSGTDTAITRLNKLIETGDELGAHQRPTVMGVKGQRDFLLGTYGAAFHAEIVGWRTQAMACIAAVLGRENDYYGHFDVATRGRESPAKSAAGAAILTALRDDIQRGYLRRGADLVAAEVFTDFLEMAEHLVETGYILPAASLIGAVFEDGLRRVAANHSIAVRRAGEDLGSLNSKCADGKVYSRLVQKQIAVWTDIQKHEDHGQFDEVRESDVKAMLEWVGQKGFLAEQLG